MEHNEDEKKFSAAVGFGFHSDRHGEGVDPALPGSSYQGPTASLPARVAENVAIADDDVSTRRLRSHSNRTSIAQYGEEEPAMDSEPLPIQWKCYRR